MLDRSSQSWLPAQALALLAFFVYATHATQALALHALRAMRALRCERCVLLNGVVTRQRFILSDVVAVERLPGTANEFVG